MIGWMFGWMNCSCCTVLQIKKFKKQSSKNYLQKNFDWIKKLLKDYETIGFSIKTLFVNLLIYYLLIMQQMHFKLISFIQAKKCKFLTKQAVGPNLLRTFSLWAQCRHTNLGFFYQPPLSNCHAPIL